MIAAALFPPALHGPLVGAEVAFYVVFGAFVVAFVVLSVITVTWALRRDRAGRDQWVRRQQQREAEAGADVPPPVTNGRLPSSRPDRRRKSPG